MTPTITGTGDNVAGSATPPSAVMADAAAGKPKATGDFALFLQAEELKEKLAREQEETAKRELKALKKANKNSARGKPISENGGQQKTHAGEDHAGHGIGGRGKPETAEERWKRRHAAESSAAQTSSYTPTGPTLEERGYFPGDLMHHGHLHDDDHHHHHHHRHSHRNEDKQAKFSPSTSKQASANTSPVMKKERLRPPAICRPGDMSDSEDQDEPDDRTEHGIITMPDLPRHDNGGGELSRQNSVTAGKQGKASKKKRSSGWLRRGKSDESSSQSMSVHWHSQGQGNMSDAGQDDDEDDDNDDRDTLHVGASPSKAASRKDTMPSASSASSSSSSTRSDEIASPNRRPNASVISLKSFMSDETGAGAESLASGGANAKIARPLLELEELELDSFLRNFGRHTREVRVAHSANFPQRRMPRWEDFRVPPGEAALAAAQGKRVTVLTHVDRGLKALEQAEGQGFPPARGSAFDGGLPSEAAAKDVQAQAHSDEQHHHHHHGFFHRKDKSKKSAPATPTTDEKKSVSRPHSPAAASAKLAVAPTPHSAGSASPSAAASLHAPRHEQSLSASAPSTRPSSLKSKDLESVTMPSGGGGGGGGGGLGLSTGVQARLTPSTNATTAPRVSWAADPSSSPKDKVQESVGSTSARTPPTDYKKSDKHQQQQETYPRPDTPEIGSSSLMSRFFGRFSAQSTADKDERVAKKQENMKRKQGHGKSALAEHGGPVNIHDERLEWRPSRDEQSLNEEEWELLQTGGLSPHGGDNDDVEADLAEERLVDDSLMDAGDVAEEDDDRQVDGIAWAIAYILATIERYAPEELDNTPDQTYRESRTRSHIERLYLIAPFWERLLFGIRRVYRWDDPRRTSIFAMSYFTIWYLDLIPAAFLLMLMFYVCQFRFFPPSASYLHEQVRMRMARGVDADRLAERLRRRSRLDVLEIYKRFVVAYGAETQLAAGDIADFHEKVKNLILWRNPTATWRTLTLLGIAAVFVTFASPHFVWKTIFGFLGFTFFILLPLQSHYPRFRRPLSPVWWALWGAPTDAQFAIQLLRRRHLERQHAKHPPNSKGKAGIASSSAAAAAASQAGDLAATDDVFANDESLSGKDRRKASSSHGDGGASGSALGLAEGAPSSSDTVRLASGFKDKVLKHSSAAQAVAYGALKPFRSSDSTSGINGLLRRSTSSENLLDLQDIKVLESGQIMSQPRKLGSFFCQHHGAPGHLHVTTRMLYFVALHSYAASATSRRSGGDKGDGDSKGGKGVRKTCKTPLSEISGMVKTKSIKLFVWNSSGLQITRRNKSSLFFSNMPHRDNAFNLLLAIGSEVWHRH